MLVKVSIIENENHYQLVLKYGYNLDTVEPKNGENRMNLVEKVKQQRLIVQNIEGINLTIKAIVKAKDAYRAEVKRLSTDGAQDYTQQYVEKALQEQKNRWQLYARSEYESVKKSLEQLQMLIQERDAQLDLNNPALSAAVSLIASTGRLIDFEQATKINANFAHDQSALIALKAAYRAHNTGDNPGNIDAMIYSPDSKIKNLIGLAEAGIAQDGSINYFVTELAKLAQLEGASVENLPDTTGASEVMRRAAGLPVS